MQTFTDIVLAFVPAIALGLINPSIFRLLGSDIKGPPDKRYKVISIITLPWFAGAAWWMLWFRGISANWTQSELFMYSSFAFLLTVICAALATAFMQYTLPALLYFLNKFALWLQKKTVQ